MRHYCKVGSKKKKKSAIANKLSLYELLHNNTHHQNLKLMVFDIFPLLQKVYYCRFSS